MNAKDKKVIFLDRDGVINKKPPRAQYVTQWSEFIFLPGAIEGLQLLTREGYDIFIVTNQPGISRGMMKEKDLQEIHEKLLEKCKKEGVVIKRIYYCLHGWDEGCMCRKPKPGMLLQAAAEYNFDLTKAFFIGDDKRDKEAGDAAGCQTILMKSDSSLLQIVQKI